MIVEQGVPSVFHRGVSRRPGARGESAFNALRVRVSGLPLPSSRDPDNALLGLAGPSPLCLPFPRGPWDSRS